MSKSNGAPVSDLERIFLRTITSLSGLMEIRDLYTLGHQNRASDIARRIANEMGLDATVVDGVRFGATLHDIGKIGIPSDILNKPAKLDGEEYGLIKTHTTKGYTVLKGIDFPWPVAEMVYQHHERLDGTGYPLGLAGDEILLEAQIIGVADTLDSINSYRPYRQGLGLEEAMRIIKEGAGSVFSTEVVDACCRLAERKEMPLGQVEPGW